MSAVQSTGALVGQCLLPGRMTPQQAWDATAEADPPRLRPAPTSGPAPVGGAGGAVLAQYARPSLGTH